MSWELDYVVDAEAFDTGLPVRVARLFDPSHEHVILCCDDGEGWFPTWVGPQSGDAVQLPGRWELSDELLNILSSAATPKPVVEEEKP